MAANAIKQLVVRFVQRHPALVIFIVGVSIIAAVVYELIDGGNPHESVVEAPELDLVDLRGHRPQTLWRDDDEFKCLGWRATHGCTPYGSRDRSRDRRCDEPLPRVSGYCEVRNATSGEIFHVMLATCKSWRWALVDDIVTCRDARNFTDFRLLAAAYRHPLPTARIQQPQTQKPPHAMQALALAAADPSATTLALSTFDTQLNQLPPQSFARGIALIAFPKAIAGVYAIVRLLRFLGCALPVEVWIDPTELPPHHSILQALVAHHDVTLRSITDRRATKFFAKPYVIYHSAFESVLFLDSDNIPAKDPTYLFDSPAFQTTGALFWPDFWRPMEATVFNIQPQSALWQLLDVPFIDMFEQESGQVLVNRTASAAALNRVMFYASGTDASGSNRLLTTYALVYGDKDLFRFAWLTTQTRFTFVQHVLALGGLYDPTSNFFCGVAMVQRDVEGDIVFLHRNQAKLSGRRDAQRPLLTHLQKFTGSSANDLDKYRIQCKVRRLNQSICFRINPVTVTNAATPLLIQSLAKTTIPAIEKQAIRYSIEARSLLTTAEEKALAALEEVEILALRANADAAAVRAAQNDQTTYSLRVCGMLVGIGALWKGFIAYRKKIRLQQDSDRDRGQREGEREKEERKASVGLRQRLASTDVAVDMNSGIGGGAHAVRRKKSVSFDDEQHIL